MIPCTLWTNWYHRGVAKEGISEGGVVRVVPIFANTHIPKVLIFVSFAKVILVKNMFLAVIPIPGGPIIVHVIILIDAGPLPQCIGDTKSRLVDRGVAQVQGRCLCCLL